MKKFIYLLGFITLGMIASCEREVESTELGDAANLVEITGQWEVTAYNDSVPVFGPFKVITLKDISAGNDSITIQDSEMKFWEFHAKVFADEKNGTFETKLSTCKMSGESIGIKISNGKVLDSDSIYFEIQFEDDETPYGNTYKLKGRRINE